MLRQTHKKRFTVLAALTVTYFITWCLPRPDWLTCGVTEYSAAPLIRYKDGVFLAQAKVIDPNLRGVLRMFMIYNETLVQGNASAPDRSSRQFSHLSKLSVLPSVDLDVLSRSQEIRQNSLLANRSRNSVTPECVRFSGPQEMKDPLICIHPPEKDKVISMFLRDSGTWEMDRLIDMEWSLQAYPDMQLVDLGCNVGVFTLYAAGMGRHVVAVDVLPGNLKLLQASLTLNDHRNSAYATLLNAKYLYPARQKIAKTGSTIHSETSRFSSVGINETRETDVWNKSFNRSKLNDVNILRAKKTDESYKEKFRIKRKQKNKFRQRKISRALLQFEESFNASSKNNSKKVHNYDRTIVQNSVLKKNSSEMLNNGVNRTGLIKNYKEVVTNNSISPNIDSHSENTTDVKLVKLRNAATEIHRISELVTLVHNAVYSDRSSRLAVHISPDGNIGGSEVVPINSDLLDDQPGDLILVDTVCLDDLLPLVKAPSVYLKMDIEGSEPHALKCAEKFFEKLHVRFVLMEWLFQLRTSGKSRSAAPDMIRFFTAKGYIPTTGAGLDVRGEAGENRGVYVLDVNFWYRWPELILWMER